MTRFLHGRDVSHAAWNRRAARWSVSIASLRKRDLRDPGLRRSLPL